MKGMGYRTIKTAAGVGLVLWLASLSTMKRLG